MAGTTLYLCSCGESKKFPYCDGSHKAANARNLAAGNGITTFVPYVHAVSAYAT